MSDYTINPASNFSMRLDEAYDGDGAPIIQGRRAGDTTESPAVVEMLQTIVKQFGARPNGLPAPQGGPVDPSLLQRLTDDATMLASQAAEMLVLFAQKMKQALSVARNAASQDSIQALQNASQHARDAAENRYQAEMTNAVGEIASGAIEVVGALGSLDALRAQVPAGAQEAQFGDNAVNRELLPEEQDQVQGREEHIANLKAEKESLLLKPDSVARNDEIAAVDKEIATQQEKIDEIKDPGNQAQRERRKEYWNNKAVRPKQISDQKASLITIRSALGAGFSKVIKGLFDLLAAQKNHDAALDDVDSKKSDIESERAKTKEGTLADLSGTLAQTVQQAIGAVEKLLQLLADSTSTIIHA
jgi:hypothetical protein